MEQEEIIAGDLDIENDGNNGDGGNNNGNGEEEYDARTEFASVLYSMGVAIKDRDLDSLTTYVESLDTANLNDDESDQLFNTLICLVLLNTTSEEVNDLIRIIVTKWQNDNPEELRYPFLTHCLTIQGLGNDDFDQEQINYVIANAYPEKSYFNYMQDLINGNPKLTSLGMMRLEKIYGEADYDTLLVVFELLNEQEERDEYRNQEADEYISGKIKEVSPYAEIPSWINLGKYEEVPVWLIIKKPKKAISLGTQRFLFEDSIGYEDPYDESSIWDDLTEINEFPEMEEIPEEGTLNKRLYEILEENKEKEKELSITEIPSDEKIVDIITEGFVSLGLTEEDKMVNRRGLEQRIRSLGTAEKKVLLDPYFNSLGKEELGKNTELYRILGPVNSRAGNNLGVSNECSIFGGCRMFTCKEFEKDNFDNGEEINTVGWFRGSCDVCDNRIKEYFHAVRRPLPNGGWVGCYCSWKCTKESNSNPDMISRKIIQIVEENINVIGIQNRLIVERDFDIDAPYVEEE